MKDHTERQKACSEALRACVDVMLHNGVPTDKDHPARVALTMAESALESTSSVAPGESIAVPSAVLDALESIQRYGLDTLSGRADGPDDREWQRAAVNEMTKRARLAIEKLHSQTALESTPPITAFSEPAGAGDVRGLPNADEIMQLLTPREKTFVSPESVIAVLKLCNVALAAPSQAAAPAVDMAVAQGEPHGIPGLVTSTDEDDGRVTLQFIDEQAASSFMLTYGPTVDIDVASLPRASDAQATAAHAGATWKLVPVEPTETMVTAANEVEYCEDGITHGQLRAAINAAPTPVATTPAALDDLDGSAAVIPVTPRELAGLKNAPSTAAQGATDAKAHTMACDLQAEQTFLGSCYESCDDSGKARWKRLQRVIDHLTAPTPVADSAAAFKASIRKLYDTNGCPIINVDQAFRLGFAAAKPVSVDASGMTERPKYSEPRRLNSRGYCVGCRCYGEELDPCAWAHAKNGKQTPPTESTGEPK